MTLAKTTLSKKKIFISGFTPRDLRNCVWKCTQEPPETKFEDGSRQCDSGRFRSLKDIWNICNSYFPGTTLDDVLYHLARLCYKKYCVNNFCSTINRPVFYKNSIYDGQVPGNIRGRSNVAKKLRELQKKHKSEWDAE